MSQNLDKTVEPLTNEAKPTESPAPEPMTKSKKRRMKKQAKQATEAASEPNSGIKSVTIDKLQHLPRSEQLVEINKRNDRRKKLLETYS